MCMTLLIKIKGKGAAAAERGILNAAKIIRSGGIVIFPTETVYGIGANALDQRACSKIYKIKGRPSDNPLIVHVSSMRMADAVGIIPPRYRAALLKVWPAPLTVIVRARKGLNRVVRGGLNTVAIRMPDNQIALRLIEQSKVPIAAPSANISMKPSSTTAEHAIKYFNGKVDAIISSSPSEFGIESTVLDLRNFSILRPGAYTPERIRQKFGRKPTLHIQRSAAKRPPSPGMKYRHYSPEKPLFLFEGSMGKLPSIADAAGNNLTFIGSAKSCAVMKGHCADMICLGNSSRQKEIAHNLFAALIELDSRRSGFGVIECFRENGMGIAIMNRIRKACSGRSFSTASGLLSIMRSMPSKNNVPRRKASGALSKK